MNGCLPNWKTDDSRLFHDLPVTNEKKYIGPDNELIELLWRNGHVVLHSQTNCRALPTSFESKQTQKLESLMKCGDSIVNLGNFIEEDETAPWFQYPLDNSTENEFSEFFYGMATAEPIRTDKAIKEDSNACAKQPGLHPQENVMPLPSGGTVVGMADPSSMRTIVSSVCGSNQAQNQFKVSHALSNVREAKDTRLRSTHDHLQTNTYEPVIASSSGGSGCSFGGTAQKTTTNRSRKRKGRDAEEFEGHSEETEYESAEANKPAHRPASSRRSRAADVHNLSERRRRDKINEKMRALQELIPHCNKSDKASMLDEVIEYLKSLQLQLQIMWMGSGIVPMLFPSIHQYMPRMGIGINHHSMTPIRSPSQLPKAPHDDQSITATSIPNQPPVFPLQFPGSINVPTQMHSLHFPEQYSSSLGFPQMQVPQVMNMCTYGPQMMQKNQIVSAVDKQPHASI